MTGLSEKDIEKALDELSANKKITIQQFDPKKGELYLNLGPMRAVFGMGLANYLEEELKKRFPSLKSVLCKFQEI